MPGIRCQEYEGSGRLLRCADPSEREEPNKNGSDDESLTISVNKIMPRVNVPQG
jgi:hypothetical protein